MGDLSKNFSRYEFRCRGEHCCGHSAPVMPDLVHGCQALRDIVGPITVNSGFRCRVHNTDVGGSLDSYHCLAMAADLMTPDGLTSEEFAKIAEGVSVFRHGGIGVYSNRIHVDTRHGAARWTG